jgi:hypothetical protein
MFARTQSKDCSELARVSSANALQDFFGALKILQGRLEGKGLPGLAVLSILDAKLVVSPTAV